MSTWFKYHTRIIFDYTVFNDVIRDSEINKSEAIGLWTVLLALASESKTDDGQLIEPTGNPICIDSIAQHAYGFYEYIDPRDYTDVLNRTIRIVEKFISRGMIEVMPSGVLRVATWFEYKVDRRQNDWGQYRDEVYNRDGECVYCGASPEHIDHIIPVSKRGPSSINNLVAACQRCNISKNNNDLEEWYKKQPYFSEKRLAYVRSVLHKYEWWAINP